MAETSSWDKEDRWWREHFASRPYASGSTYDEFRPAYEYGFESGRHHMGRTWDDVEPDLRTGWEKHAGRGTAGSTWERVKDAVRDAWHRVTGQGDLVADEVSESSREGQWRGS